MERGGELGEIWEDEGEGQLYNKTSGSTWVEANIRTNNTVGLLWCLKREKSGKRRYSETRNILAETGFILP